IGNRASAGGAIVLRTPTTFPVQVVESTFKENQARPTAFNAPSAGYEARFDENGGGGIQNNGNLSVKRTLFEANNSELTKGRGGRAGCRNLDDPRDHRTEHGLRRRPAQHVPVDALSTLGPLWQLDPGRLMQHEAVHRRAQCDDWSLRDRPRP